MIAETVTRDGGRDGLTPRPYANDNQYIIQRSFTSKHNLPHGVAAASSDPERGTDFACVMLAFYTLLTLPFYIAVVGTLVLSLFVYLKSF